MHELDAVLADIRSRHAAQPRPPGYLNHRVRPFEGCTDREIEEIRADQRVAFVPAPFRSFLAAMGRSAGGFLVGTDAFYPALLGVKAGANECLAENGAGWTLGDGAMVVNLHQGYDFCWFPSIERPEVRRYVEGRGIVAEWPTFAACLQEWI